jgi:hypothetical protein
MMMSRQVSAGSAGSKHNLFEKQKNNEKDLIHHIGIVYVFTLLTLLTLLASLQPIIT